MLIPRRIRRRAQPALPVAEALKTAEDWARDAVAHKIKVGLLVPMEEHDAALEALRRELENAASENARHIIETWRWRWSAERQARRDAEGKLASLEADAVPLQAWEVADRERQDAKSAAESASMFLAEAERAQEAAKRDAEAWRLRALDAESDLEAAELRLEEEREAYAAAERARRISQTPTASLSHRKLGEPVIRVDIDWPGHTLGQADADAIVTLVGAIAEALVNGRPVLPSLTVTEAEAIAARQEREKAAAALRARHAQAIRNAEEIARNAVRKAGL